MKINYLWLCALLFPFQALAASSIFCPLHYKTVTLGMTESQVIAACGQPLSKQESNKPAVKKMPLTQLFYNNEGPARAAFSGTGNPVTPASIYYGIWNNATAISGVELQVEIVDNKVYAVRINGSDENAFSVCRGIGIRIGDPLSKVYAACGPALQTNQTFINVNMVSEKKPEVWIYQLEQYRPPLSLTFVEGKLQSID